MMWVVIMLLPSLAFTTVKAQDTLVLDIKKALEIALSENPTVKVANKEIQKKKYAQKGSYAALFPQVSFAADYNRTLKKQVMYMDGFDMGSTEIPGMEDMPNMDEGIEVGRDNNWNLGFNASMPIVNAALWKSLSISAVDVELAIEQARSSKIAMVNQVKKGYYGVLLANDSYRVFKESYDNAMENYLDIKHKFEQGTVAEYDLIRANVTVKNSEPNMLQAENALVLAKWQLKALLGMDLDINIECEGQLTDFEKDLFGDFLSTDTTLANNTDGETDGFASQATGKDTDHAKVRLSADTVAHWTISVDSHEQRLQVQRLYVEPLLDGRLITLYSYLLRRQQVL